MYQASYEGFTIFAC